MATNNMIPIWTTTITPDAEDDAGDDPRGDAQDFVPAVLVLRTSVEIIKALKIRDPSKKDNTDTPSTMRNSPDKIAF